MFWHDFLGSLADNMVEVNWMLVVTLFPVMAGADDIVAMSGLLWLTSGLWGQLFSSSPIVLAALANPLVWTALGATVVVRSRYYVLLSLTRVLYKQYNGFPNTSFAVITAVVTPLATVVFLNWLGWGLLAAYTVGLVVACLQTWVFEACLRRRQITL